MKKKKKDDFYFDDCPICQAMKDAENKGGSLSEEKLIKAFEKARKKGAIVGTNLKAKKQPIN